MPLQLEQSNSRTPLLVKGRLSEIKENEIKETKVSRSSFEKIMRLEGVGDEIVSFLDQKDKGVLKTVSYDFYGRSIIFSPQHKWRLAKKAYDTVDPFVCCSFMRSPYQTDCSAAGLEEDDYEKDWCCGDNLIDSAKHPFLGVILAPGRTTCGDIRDYCNGNHSACECEKCLLLFNEIYCGVIILPPILAVKLLSSAIGFMIGARKDSNIKAKIRPYVGIPITLSLSEGPELQIMEDELDNVLRLQL